MDFKKRDIVFTNGCFDLFHVGHLATLKFARAVADYNSAWLFVGVNSDESIRKLKGWNRPIIRQEHRKEILEALSIVDRVIIFDELTPYKLIQDLKPTVIVKGSDYRSIKTEDIVGSDISKIVITPNSWSPDVSTTKIIKKIELG